MNVGCVITRSRMCGEFADGRGIREGAVLDAVAGVMSGFVECGECEGERGGRHAVHGDGAARGMGCGYLPYEGGEFRQLMVGDHQLAGAEPQPWVADRCRSVRGQGRDVLGQLAAVQCTGQYGHGG